jgi:hypothetical protein
MSVDIQQTTQRYIPEDCTLYNILLQVSASEESNNGGSVPKISFLLYVCLGKNIPEQK